MIDPGARRAPTAVTNPRPRSSLKTPSKAMSPRYEGKPTELLSGPVAPSTPPPTRFAGRDALETYEPAPVASGQLSRRLGW
jgi:hypothetical protein